MIKKKKLKNARLNFFLEKKKLFEVNFGPLMSKMYLENVSDFLVSYTNYHGYGACITLAK